MQLKGLVILVLAFVVAWAVTKLLIPVLQKKGVLDVPNARSSHAAVIPRGGGIGIVAGLVVGWLAAFLLGMSLPGIGLIAGTALIAAIGFLDDRAGSLSVQLRLLLQLVAAAIAVGQSGGLERLPLPEPLDIQLGIFATPVAVIWIVAVLNIYNFLDGIDGFAGVQGAIAGLAFALLGQSDLLTASGLAIAGACAGFLVHNWHPAKVFMGDIGSGTLGFVLGALPFQLSSTSRTNTMFAVFVCLWFFLSDGVFTMLRRLLRGERIWEAHRSHLYQRLVQAGMSHDKVVLKVTFAAAVFAALAVVAVRSAEASAQWGVLMAACGAFLAYYLWTAAREKTFQRNLGVLKRG
jgi:Fuc2NAc and GlcNAc transferase